MVQATTYTKLTIAPQIAVQGVSKKLMWKEFTAMYYHCKPPYSNQSCSKLKVLEKKPEVREY